MKSYRTLLIIIKLILITLVTLTHSVCIHDQVQSKNVPRKHLVYEDTGHGHSIHKRSGRGPPPNGDRRPPPPFPPPRPRPGFRKIRVHCDYQELDTELTQKQQELIKSVVEDGMSKVKDIFSGNSILYNF